jgi:transcriptional regulator with XRE-family HTH domain
MIFNEKLRRLMVARSHTQQSLAVDLGVSQKSVSNWISGIKPHKLKTQKLADYFNIPIEILLDDNEPLPAGAVMTRNVTITEVPIPKTAEAAAKEAQENARTREGGYSSWGQILEQLVQLEEQQRGKLNEITSVIAEVKTTLGYWKDGSLSQSVALAKLKPLAERAGKLVWPGK